jgi:hypothetical protein
MADKKLIVDLAKGTQTYVDLTPEEIQQRELDAIAAATEKAERDAIEAAELAAKESGKAKLSALGLTQEEVAALLK